MNHDQKTPLVGIACGGTGGHLFPGLTVGEELLNQGCRVTLIVSSKAVDQQAVSVARDMSVLTIPAVGLSRGRLIGFASGFWKSYQLSRAWCHEQQPSAVLAMGGFTSAPPVLAAHRVGAATMLHDSNAIPGRANRWLAPSVDWCFVGLPEAAKRLRNPSVVFTGTPVRPQFQPQDAASCRVALGLNPDRDVLVVMGGSQGAGAINDLLLRSLGSLAESIPDLQFIHLTGEADAGKVRDGYQRHCRRAVVRAFLTEMELALGAATIAISRAGGSSLAELAAIRVPAILIPYPAAADNHQYFNARALADSGAAQLLVQSAATPEALTGRIIELTRDGATRTSMIHALAAWHAPYAAERIALRILQAMERRGFPKPIGRERPSLDDSPSDDFRAPPPGRLARGPIPRSPVPV